VYAAAFAVDLAGNHMNHCTAYYNLATFADFARSTEITTESETCSHDREQFEERDKIHWRVFVFVRLAIDIYI
jgi:hypothetical protein